MNEDSLTGEKDKSIEHIRKEAEERSCPVQKALYYIEEFIAGPMCSKCFPCALGTGEAKIRLMRISRHSEDVAYADVEALRRIGISMIQASFCKKGKDTGRFIVDLFADSEEDIRQHISGICPERECISLIAYTIKPELCTMCGKCSEVCRYHAIVGEKKQPYLSGYLPFEIRQKRCTKCGECIKVCPEGAIEVITVLKEALAGKE